MMKAISNVATGTMRVLSDAELSMISGGNPPPSDPSITPSDAEQVLGASFAGYGGIELNSD
jgi:hypothetical protein